MGPVLAREVQVPPAGRPATTPSEPAVTNEFDGPLEGPVRFAAPRHDQDEFGTMASEVVPPDAPGEFRAAAPGMVLPEPPVTVVIVPAWRSSRASFYGPGFYGKGLACPGVLTEALVGVAHRFLPCGTLVTFRNPANGIVITVPVVDRGPFIAGRDWDLTGGACLVLDFCYTGVIDWHLGGP